jgi:hypothetical protein
MEIRPPIAADLPPDRRELITMSFRTGTPAVDPRSHAGQRQVSSETVHRAAAARWVTGVSDGRSCRPQSLGDGAAGTGRATTRDMAERDVRCDREGDAATTVAAMVGDDVTGAVTLNDRGNVVAVIYATGSRGLLVRHDPSCKQR